MLLPTPQKKKPPEKSCAPQEASLSKPFDGLFHGHLHNVEVRLKVNPKTDSFKKRSEGKPF
jgi:hypothetical protein